MTNQLETKLADHWNKPLAELPLLLRGLLRYIFRDTPWDTIKSKQRREIVAQWRGDIAIGMVGYNLVLQHDGPAPDLTNYLGLEVIDIGAFEALTDTAEGVHGDFTIAADSVHATPIDAHTLSLLSRDDRRFIREFLKLRLALPCTPVQLVEFVDATEGAFTLPEGYAEKVRSGSVVAGAAPAKEAEPSATVGSGVGEGAPAVPGWKMKIQIEATELVIRLRKSGASPTKQSIVGPLARWCRANEVLTDGNIFPSANYLRTHVLGGKHWDLPN